MASRLTIGREVSAVEGDTLEVVDDPQLSKQHVCIAVVDATAMVIDLGSSNGTFLVDANGRAQVSSDRWIPVQPESWLEFGNQRASIDVIDAEQVVRSGRGASHESDGDRRRLLFVGAGLLALFAVVAVGLFVVFGTGGDETAATSRNRDAEGEDDSEDDARAEQDDVEATAEPALGEFDDVVDNVLDDERVGDGRLGESARPAPDELPLLPIGDLQQRWTFPIDASFDSPPTFHDDLVFMATLEIGGPVVWGLDRTDGSERWATDLVVDDADRISNLGVIDGVVYVQSCAASCAVFSLDSAGAVLWQSETSGDARGRVVHSRLYLEHDGRVELLDTATGVVVRGIDGDLGSLERYRPSASVEETDASGQVVATALTVYDFDLNPAFGPLRIEAGDELLGDVDGPVVVTADDGVLEFRNSDATVGRVVAIDVDWRVVDVVVVAEDLVVIETDDDDGELIRGLDTAGDQAEVLWTRPSFSGVEELYHTRVGPLLVPKEGEPGPFEVIHAETGSVVVDSGQNDDTFFFVGSNGLARARFDFGTDTNELVVFDFATGLRQADQLFPYSSGPVGHGVVIEWDDDELTFYE